MHHIVIQQKALEGGCMKIGNTSFPLYRVNTLLKDTRVIYEKLGRKEVSKEHIAEVLGQKVGGGGFTQKLADLRSYGLLNGGYGKYALSEIGVHATFGTPKEKADALDRAVKNVELWRQVYEKVGISPNPETFWLELVDLTGIERPEAQTKAEEVRKAYMEDAKYILTVEAPEEEPDSKKDDSGSESTEARDRKDKMETTHSFNNVCVGNAPYIGFPDYIQAPIIIKDETSFKAAKVFWDAIEAKFGKKDDKNTTP
jgi:hypothetical protein